MPRRGHAAQPAEGERGRWRRTGAEVGDIKGLAGSSQRSAPLRGPHHAAPPTAARGQRVGSSFDGVRGPWDVRVSRARVLWLAWVAPLRGDGAFGPSSGRSGDAEGPYATGLRRSDQAAPVRRLTERPRTGGTRCHPDRSASSRPAPPKRGQAKRTPLTGVSTLGEACPALTRPGAMHNVRSPIERAW